MNVVAITAERLEVGDLVCYDGTGHLRRWPGKMPDCWGWLSPADAVAAWGALWEAQEKARGLRWYLEEQQNMSAQAALADYAREVAGVPPLERW